jgi:hypothetical protein
MMKGLAAALLLAILSTAESLQYEAATLNKARPYGSLKVSDLDTILGSGVALLLSKSLEHPMLLAEGRQLSWEEHMKLAVREVDAGKKLHHVGCVPSAKAPATRQELFALEGRAVHVR